MWHIDNMWFEKCEGPYISAGSFRVFFFAGRQMCLLLHHYIFNFQAVSGVVGFLLLNVYRNISGYGRTHI